MAAFHCSFRNVLTFVCLQEDEEEEESEKESDGKNNLQLFNLSPSTCFQIVTMFIIIIIIPPPR